jgi:hypothetical protein
VLRTARPVEAGCLQCQLTARSVWKEDEAILEEAIPSTVGVVRVVRTISQQSDDGLLGVDVISILPSTSLMRDLLTGLTLPQLIYVAIFCFISSLLLLLKRSPRSKPSPRSVAILVLGDVGRSPRMMYHAESFAKLQFDTFLVGYQGNVSLAVVASLRTPRLAFLTGQFATCRL